MKLTESGEMPKVKKLREFGLVLGVGLLVIGLFPLYRSEPVRLWAVASGGAFAALGLLYPRSLLVPFRVWMKIGYVLMTVNTKVILSVIYIFLVFPIGLLLRVAGKDVLGLRYSGDTYWAARAAEDADVDFERMF